MKAKLYTLSVRQPNGSWYRDELPVTLKEAKAMERMNRIIGGISTQITPATPAEVEAYKQEYGEP